MEKKAQINKMFVYILSIIMVLFIGFLVVKFISAFTSDTKDIVTNKFYEQIEKDYKTVLTTYGAEKIMTYRFKEEVKAVCFANSRCDFDNSASINVLDNLSDSAREELKFSVESGDNVVLFDDVGLLDSRNIGTFEIGQNCQCFAPKQNMIEIVMENQRSKVLFKSLD